MSSNTTHVGIWVDYSKGPLLGSTLTLPSRGGFLLTAAIAMFVQLTGTHFWGIVKFALHQIRSDQRPHDALFYQQQAVLRNSSSADTWLQLAKISVAWHSKSLRRSVLLMLISAVHLVGFIAAGIFSSNVVITNPGVLVRGSSCGLWPFHLNLTEEVQVNFTEQVDFTNDYLTNAILSARDVKSCITPNTTKLETPEHECDVSTGKVKWHVDKAAPCPFETDMCVTGALKLDSGRLDSDTDFGINAPVQSRVTYQKVLTCAPIKTNGFVSNWTAGSSNSNDPGAGYLYFYYGPSQPYSYGVITGYGYTSWISNHTALTYHNVAPTSEYVLYYLEFVPLPATQACVQDKWQSFVWGSLNYSTAKKYLEASDVERQKPWISTVSNLTISMHRFVIVSSRGSPAGDCHLFYAFASLFPIVDVTITNSIHLYSVRNSPWGFSPIKQLNKTEADVSLFFLTSLPYFMEPVDDPWFAAHINTTFSSDPPTAVSGLKFYLADYHVSVLGCTEQHQFCNPTNPASTSCTPLAGTVQVNNSLGGLGFNPLQQATAHRMFETMGQTTMPRIARALGTNYMVATSSLSGTVSLALPTDQWVLEVFNWADIMMATFQRKVIEFATGPSNPQFANYLRRANTAEEHQMCYNQKVPSPPGYTSFSVVGLSIILGVSALIILVNCVLEQTVYGIQRWQNTGLYRRMAWVLDGTLQLQRMAFESSGLGKWDRCTDEVPITPLGEKFPLTTTSNPEHPTLSPRIPQDLELNTLLAPEETNTAAVQSTQPVHPRHWGLAKTSGYMSLPDDGVGPVDDAWGYDAMRR